MTKEIINYHVPDQTNIGDLLSSPLKYFDFPGFNCQVKDVRAVDESNVDNTHMIIGGGGLAYGRFLPNIKHLANQKKQTMIFWGIGQQQYGRATYRPHTFNYKPYFEQADLVGIRDYGVDYEWVPCVSCMHPSFDKPRTAKNEFVILSHKKFQITFSGIPRMTNETNNFEEVLDFLGSGETILTTSFHAAYWGTLLKRKVLVFPFNSKFITMKHVPGIYPAKNWTRERWKVTLLRKTLYRSLYPGNIHACDTENWRDYINKGKVYTNSLEECRERNRQFYSLVMDKLSG